MKIAILSRKPSLYSTRRLKEAGERRGHDVHVVNYLRCYMDITSHRPQVMYQGRILEGYDAVIPRVGASQTSYGTAVVRQFEMMGVFCVNGSQGIQSARDKLRCLQVLARQGIGLPVTGCAHSTKDSGGLVKIVGGPPLVVKMLQGTQGVGVVLAENQEAAESVIEAFRGIKADILVQEFIRESAGSDVRAFVVGGRVIAAMRRQARPGEFRANLHRGGTASPIRLTPEERTTAVRAAKATGLLVAGVDILRSAHGPLVLEVNASPGLEGIERATGVDVAACVYDFIEKSVVSGLTRARAGA